MRTRVKLIASILLGIFLVPLAARAALFAFEDRPATWRDADWSSAGLLPKPADAPDARLLIFSGRTGGLKGLVAVHSWVVVKRANAKAWSRYDVVGWGSPVRLNGWVADGRWFGSVPTVVADVRGAEAEALIPKVEAAIKGYRYSHFGDYRLWPGPNSNTFVATVLRAVPELGVALPPNAVGKDFRNEGFYVGLTDSGTGIEMSVFGLLGVKLGWVEGLEVNLLGLVSGLDFKAPALKLPGFGRIGLPFPTATEANAATH
ncbi:MAG: DUF3750 domain-containing protein [Variibacter sp.]